MSSKARRIIRQKLKAKQDALSGIPAITGNHAGVVSVPERAGWIYVRIGNQVVEVFNSRVASVADIPVVIGVDPFAPNLLQVLSMRSSGAISGNAERALSIPSHHTKHEWPNEDAVFVDLRQLMPLRVSPAGDYKIFIHRAVVAIGDTVIKVEPTETVDLYNLVPVAPDYARYVLITLDTSGAVSVTAGTEVAIDDLDLSDIPARPAGHRRLAAVRLYYGQSSIVEAISTNDIVDLRWNFDAAAAEAHASMHENGGGDEISVAGLSGELADPQPPKSHASSHQSGGADAIKLDDLAAPDDNTDLDANTSKHGLMPKFPGGTNLLRGDGTWVPASSSDPLSNVVKTVGSGKDFSTIQAAINWFKSYIVVTGCRIDIDAGEYTENLDISGLLITAPDGLEIRGDTRQCAGKTYINGNNSLNVYGAYSVMANSGTGTATISKDDTTKTLTIACATTNPNFATDGWAAGDKVMTYDGTTWAEHTLTAVSGNVLTKSTAWPTITTNFAVVFCPNRKITSPLAANGDHIYVGSSNVKLNGLRISSSFSYAINGVHLTNASLITMNNCFIEARNRGVFLERSSVISNMLYFPNTFRGYANNGQGAFAVHKSTMQLTSLAVFNYYYGFYSRDVSFCEFNYTAGVKCAVTYYAFNMAYIGANNSNSYGHTSDDYSPNANTESTNNNSFINTTT